MRTALIAILVTGALGIANAAIVLTPPGLNAGDQYRLMFVTSTTSVATSTNIAVYNALVNAVADTVPEIAGINWMVVGSTSAVAARDNTGTNPSSTGVPVYRLDGVLLANNNADLWDGSLLAAPNVTESGGTQAARAFTGTTPFGTVETYYLGWGAAYGDPIRTGEPSFVDGRWMEVGVQGAGQLAPFYAISEVLTAVPEPGAGTLLAVGALLVGGAHRRRRSSAGAEAASAEGSCEPS